ncbi:MAG: hypothetical protein R3F61_05480 [Myxococcota bacterium]
MAKRRPMTGTPLLLATAGVVLAVGCGGNKQEGPVVTGNLMPPPKVHATVCVDKTPEDAVVRIDAEVASQRCTEIESYGSPTVSVSAPGYVTQEQIPELVADEEITLTFALVPDEPINRPVGNLMAPPGPPDPPPEPPIGNLMPPPEKRK